MCNRKNHRTQKYFVRSFLFAKASASKDLDIMSKKKQDTLNI